MPSDIPASFCFVSFNAFVCFFMEYLGKIEGDTMGAHRENAAIFFNILRNLFAATQPTSKDPKSETSPPSLSADYGTPIPMGTSGFLEKCELKELLSLSLSHVTVEDVFLKFFSDTPASLSFQQDYHVRRSEQEIHIGKWTPHERFGNFKESTYNTPVKIRVPGIPSITPVMEKSRFSLTPSWMELEILVQTFGVPYSDYFVAQQRWHILEDKAANGVRIKVSGAVYFVKKTWLQGKIEGETMRGVKESVDIWVDLVAAALKQSGVEVAPVVEEGKKGDEVKSVGDAVNGAVGGGGESVTAPLQAMAHSSFHQSLRRFSSTALAYWDRLAIALFCFLHILLLLRLSLFSQRVSELEEMIPFPEK
jgi:hypothetical protein